jgi:RNA polymerase sigma-70 factor (ECF subfamily)
MTSPLSGNSEIELLRRMFNGEEEAFAAIYQQWWGGIYRFALQMSGSNAIAEDVTQEVFLFLIKNPARFDAGRGSISSFLYGISRNLVLQTLQKKRQLVSLGGVDSENEGGLDQILTAPHDPLADLTRQEGIDALRRAILGLPIHYREVVVLCDLEEMSYAEAAQVIGCAVGTIRSRLNRAHGLLLERLKSAKQIQAAPSGSQVARSLV